MPFKEINILRRHGKQFVPDLRNALLPEIFRGRPLISNNITAAEAEMLHDLCPVDAIGVNSITMKVDHLPDSSRMKHEEHIELQGKNQMNSEKSLTDTPVCSIDIGKCIFCRECEFALPGKIRFTNDFKLATNVRENLIIHAGNDQPINLDPSNVRKEIRSLFRHALKLRQVSAGGENSAEMELNAAGNVNFDMGRYGIEFVASPRHADGIVITGPISENMAEALQITYDAIPSPKIIILAGSDAISGGSFAESGSLNREFLNYHHVDLYVPGNPPHPLTFINGILDLIGR